MDICSIFLGNPEFWAIPPEKLKFFPLPLIYVLRFATLTRSPNQPHIQLINRLLQQRAEQTENKRRQQQQQPQPQQQGPQFKNLIRGVNAAAGESYYKTVKIRDIQFSAKREGDRYCEVVEKDRHGNSVLSLICCTRFIKGGPGGENSVEGVRLIVLKDEFFDKPFRASRIGVRQTKDNVSGHHHKWSFDSIRRKLYRLPLYNSDISVVIPMMDSYSDD
jgi:hypothetical protein